MRIAIEGCLHGQLEDVYRHIEDMEEKLGLKFDALIVCGDFQSLRHQGDMDDMHCPQKYKNMGCFRDYYEKRRVAPVLTILIGGNHEAVNSLRQSHFGGWLAPNFYFLGQSGSIFLCKGKERIRITGCSGIYNQADFKYCTRIERYPLRGKDRITSYHQKQMDIFKIQLLARITTMKREKPEIYGSQDTSFDIMLSHDWPKDIALYGDIKQLYRYKPFLRNQIDTGVFGNWPMLRILKNAKPSYWFSAHMHVKYSAIYPHGLNYFTHFLSLDKCLGKRSCLQLLEFATGSVKQTQQHPLNQYIAQEGIKQVKQEPINDKVRIQVDSTWIGVLILTHSLMRGGDNLYYMQKQQVKLVDVNKMNDLIKLYATIIDKIAAIGKYSFNPDLTQIEQTKNFLQTIGISPSELQGICFEKEEIQQYNPIQDQIDLDL